MSSTLFDFLLDARHIGRRWALWQDYTRLQFAQFRNSGPGVIHLLGQPFQYADPASLLHLYRDIVINRIYDAELPPNPVIVDCGSNIGLSLAAFRWSYPGAILIGFEPSSTLFPLLEANTGGYATLYPVALSDKEGTTTFYLDGSTAGALNTGLHKTHRVNIEATVRLGKLSDYLPAEVDLLKLDIEGSEHEVLAELAASGALSRVKHLALEYHHHHHRKDQSRDMLAGFLAILERHGFGYQLDAYFRRTRRRDVYQDVLLYAYRKV